MTALYDYNSGHSDDLAFSAGDQVEVLENVDAEWSRGRLVRAPNVVGLFPSNFVDDGHQASPSAAASGFSVSTHVIRWTKVKTSSIIV